MTENPQEIVELLRKVLRLTVNEARRFSTNLLIREAPCLCQAPELPTDTARIPVLICGDYLCIRISDLGDLSYEVQKAILGYYH